MGESTGTPRKNKTSVLLPAWTKRAVMESTGRDPLGLARVSDAITDFLLPGITTQTSRARYYSFYPWCLWHIQQTEPTERSGAFVERFQRREAAFALATLLHGDGENPVGVDAASDILAEAKVSGEADTDFRVLPSNPLGGFGQYYQGSLRKLQLIRYENGVEMSAEGMGTALAQAFHNSVEAAPYIKKELFRENRIPLKELKKSTDAFNLNAIEWPAGKEERALLKNLFFGLGGNGAQAAAGQRPLSLTTVLHVLSEYEKSALPVGNDDVDNLLVYWPHYFGMLVYPRSRVIHYAPAKRLEFVHGMWRQFCLHQYLTLALEEMLAAVLDTLSRHHDGLDLDGLVANLPNKDFHSTLAERVGIVCNNPAALLAAIGIQEAPTEARCLEMQRALIPGHKFSEEDILDWDTPGAEGRLCRSVGLLAVLYSKWRGVQSDAAFRDVARHAGLELWFGPVGASLDSWLEPQTTWGSCLKAFVNGFIIQRHDLVMYQKGRLDSCWIGKVGEKYTKEQDLVPDVGSSRHWNAVRILRDLCLMDAKDGNLSLTREGKQLLERLIQ